MLSIVKLGNYLSQGVYAPFQGAVDIVVVQQDDGSFRSSPWYVRRFDPQAGNGRGRRVDIWVNDVKASFSMALNSKGEAFFEKQADVSPQLYSSNASPLEDAERLQASLEILAQHNEENLTFGRGFLLTDTQRRPVLQGELSMLPNVHPKAETVEIVDESLTIAVAKKVRVEMVEEAQFGLTSRSSDAVQCDTMLCTAIAEDWFVSQKIHTAGLEGDFLGMSDTTMTDEICWDDHVITAEDENNRSMSDDQYVASLGSVSDGLVDGNNDSKSGECSLEPAKNSCMSEKNAILKVEEVTPTKGSRDTEMPTTSSIPRSKWWSLSLRKSSAGKVSDVTSAISRDGTTQVTVGNSSIKKPLKHNVRRQLSQKRIVQSYLPSSDQISSLRLKEGSNKITFTFPGDPRKAQVDANIYLWKWNTRIVISDVDGTITKSDVLGQFMPLVGKDWSQSGVARLFSAIKENGYELLFLSARSISQSHLTRQFLGNLSQDGVTLPDGPVFISPDGLLPSLYREVIKRTPHEFKISCLEEVRKLFPRDVNPFYAGFGNRSTDEISYRRVGIPRGKIFMINPKGEVMVNNHVHVKTYTSIHELVDGMFPPVFSSEQEDFNSWNFWKLPIPNLADEISEKSSRIRRCQSVRK